jgi:PAS domain-containing protein
VVPRRHRLRRHVAVGTAATAAAAAERDRLAEILDLAPFPAWRRTRDLRIAWVNRAYASAVEADADTILHDSIEFAPGSGPPQSRSLAALARETGVAQTDTRRFDAAGERCVYEITEAPLSDGGAMGFARDVTAREEARADLKRHTQAHAAVMNRLRSAIAIFGADRKLRFFNEAHFRLWKLDEPWLQTGPSRGEILEVLREARRIPEAADFRAYKAQVMSLYASVLAPEE